VFVWCVCVWCVCVCGVWECVFMCGVCVCGVCVCLFVVTERDEVQQLPQHLQWVSRKGPTLRKQQRRKKILRGKNI